MPFRDQMRVCPRCGVHLNNTRTIVGHRIEYCGNCAGAWVTLQQLYDMFDRMAPGRGIPAWAERASTKTLGCPSCKQGMRAVAIGTIELDLCDAHGVWFDNTELAESLLHHAQVGDVWEE